jgi:RHH-type proline utilization regulon transcriptional repressor/proline dehydrogenase/delta 1-pyrroline-5-carboxylate dehydrogenase
MAGETELETLRARIRAHALADETALSRRLQGEADIGAAARGRAREKAAAFVAAARANAGRSSLIDKFLQEYGLSSAEGVTLMRLAEALLRTPDAATADALIKDKVEAGDWAAHVGKSPFPLVNFSTRGLMLTAAWLDDFEAKDPARRIVKATKDILDRVGEPVIRASVAQAMKIMGDHFVLGETIDHAMQRARGFAARGYSFSFDMLGEAAHTAADAEKYFVDYSNAIRAISEHATRGGPRDNPGISVKLSALHPRYEYAKKERVLDELGGRLRELALAAKAADISFNIDAEESYRLDISLDLIEAMMRDPALAGWEGFGVVVQAYLRRAPFVIDWLAALARETGRRMMIRLVKGAYWDGEIKRAQVMGLESYPVFTRKVLTDISYQACARRLFANTDVFYPQFATHNALTAAIVGEMAGERTDYEVQRLHGMGEALHDSLRAEGVRSRIYAPVGGHKELLPYLVRRLLENGANSSFVNQLIDPDCAIDEVVADPVEEARGLAVFPNPAISAPRDQFAGTRLSARGWDPVEPDVAAQLEQAVGPLKFGRLAVAPLIDGEMKAGEPSHSHNPAHADEIVADVKLADAALVNHACERALAAQEAWAATPASERRAILARAADMLEKAAEHFMSIAVREAGKTIPDAIAEVREATDFLRYYGCEAEKLDAPPLGVVACISPWNFPLAIFLGQVSAGLAAGNAVIAKPAGQTPLIAFEAVRILHEAGVPPGVLHLLPGGGSTVGTPLVAHPAVQGVIFTGSTAVAQIISQTLAASGKTGAALIAETGGINAMIIDSTALLEQAVTDAIASAFQSAGQRCSACRLVCVQDDVADRFNEMLAGAVAELTVGDGAKISTDVGPVIDDGARREIDQHIARMEKTARIIARAPEPEGDVDGSFVRPTAIELARVSDLEEEIFGPVLHVVRYRAENLDAIVDGINALGFGLTLGVHTRIDETMHAIVAKARVGNIYVNRNQIGAVVGVQPFGGEGLSGAGPKAGGPHYLKALVKRRRPDCADLVDVTGDRLSNIEEAALAAAAEAFESWSRTPGRAELLTRAAALADDGARAVLHSAAAMCARYFTEAETLPGPTGESNTLRLKGRGIIVCLGAEGVAATMAMALAAGNCVIAPNQAAAPVATALARAGHAGAVQGLDGLGRRVAAPLIEDSRVRGVAFDGAGRDAFARALAARRGPIAPLLTSADAPWRYAVERTLTINTTAAGGDVRLLSLAD